MVSGIKLKVLYVISACVTYEVATFKIIDYKCYPKLKARLNDIFKKIISRGQIENNLTRPSKI